MFCPGLILQAGKDIKKRKKERKCNQFKVYINLPVIVKVMKFIYLLLTPAGRFPPGIALYVNYTALSDISKGRLCTAILLTESVTYRFSSFWNRF